MHHMIENVIVETMLNLVEFITVTKNVSGINVHIIKTH